MDELSPTQKGSSNGQESTQSASSSGEKSTENIQQEVGTDENLNLLTLDKPVAEMNGSDLIELFGLSLKSPHSKRAIRECVAEEIDPLQKRLASLELSQNESTDLHAKLSERVEIVESKVDSLKNTPSSQMSNPFPREALAKRCNLIVSGIERTENETVRDLVSDLLTDLNIDLDGSFQARRIGPKDKQNQILVEFSAHWDKRKVYAARLKLANAGREGVFINEDLTKDQKHIFYEARQAAKSKLISSAWTYDGITHIARDAPGGSGKVQMAAIPSLEILQQRLPDHKISKQKMSVNLKWNSVPAKAKPSSETLVPDKEQDAAASDKEEGEIDEEPVPKDTKSKAKKSPRTSPRNANQTETETKPTAGTSRRSNLISRVVNGKNKKK